MLEVNNARWLLLMHQIPPKPNYLRVKIWRRLQRLGAVAIKNSVYALPNGDQAREDFQWVLREIVEGGGDGTLCEARLIDGVTDDQVAALFQSARSADYRQIGEDVRRLTKAKAKTDAGRRAQLQSELARLRRRLDEVVTIDFFGAPGREAARGLVADLETRLRGAKSNLTAAGRKTSDPDALKGKTWVTRKGIHVDRVASAWFVRRFIDPDAKFKFVVAKGYQPLPDELRFDMFEAEFTHVADRCTLEVLLEHSGTRDAAVRKIAEIVHDIDLKDGKFEHPETAGIERLIAGIALSHREDDARLARGAAMFDDLYEYFRRKRG